jgi:antitoxin ParD1/3/4
MNVNFTPQREELVRAKVASGRYTSASEVVPEVLRLMDEPDRLRAAELEQLRDDVREGLASGASRSWSACKMKSDARARRARKTAQARSVGFGHRPSSTDGGFLAVQRAGQGRMCRCGHVGLRPRARERDCRGSSTNRKATKQSVF